MAVAGYRVLRGGTLVTTVTGTSYIDTASPRTPPTRDELHGRPRRPQADRAYYVVAFDATGNVSPPSLAVTVG